MSVQGTVVVLAERLPRIEVGRQLLHLLEQLSAGQVREALLDGEMPLADVREVGAVQETLEHSATHVDACAGAVVMPHLHDEGAEPRLDQTMQAPNPTQQAHGQIPSFLAIFARSWRS